MTEAMKALIAMAALVIAEALLGATCFFWGWMFGAQWKRHKAERRLHG